MTRTARQADELAYRESDGISVSLRWNRERATPAGVGREVGAVFDGAGGENATEALGLLRSGGRYFSYGSATGKYIEARAAERDIESSASTSSSPPTTCTARPPRCSGPPTGPSKP